ncbi:MAG: hypothetical protein ACOZDY_19115 [Pseudomonadota bacterium]
MTHQEFRAAYRQGTVRVRMNRVPAEKLMSTRLLLPLFALPVLGLGVALALLGHWIAGLLVFLVGFGGPRLIKRSAPHFVLTQALENESWYQDAVAAGALQFEDAD